MEKYIGVTRFNALMKKIRECIGNLKRTDSSFQLIWNPNSNNLFYDYYGRKYSEQCYQEAAANIEGMTVEFLASPPKLITLVAPTSSVAQRIPAAPTSYELAKLICVSHNTESKVIEYQGTGVHSPYFAYDARTYGDGPYIVIKIKINYTNSSAPVVSIFCSFLQLKQSINELNMEAYIKGEVVEIDYSTFSAGFTASSVIGKKIESGLPFWLKVKGSMSSNRGFKVFIPAQIKYSESTSLNVDSVDYIPTLMIFAQGQLIVTITNGTYKYKFNDEGITYITCPRS